MDYMENPTGTLWQEFSLQLNKFIRSRVRDEQMAEDILHNVYVKVHSNIGKLHSEKNIRSWLFTIARNTIIDHYRGEKETVEIPPSLSGKETPQKSIEDEIERDSFRAMVNSLPEIYAEALILTEIEGLTQRELAEKAGISLSGAKSRVQRAKKLLEELMGRVCHFEFNRQGEIVDYRCTCSFHEKKGKNR